MKQQKNSSTLRKLQHSLVVTMEPPQQPSLSPGRATSGNSQSGKPPLRRGTTVLDDAGKRVTALLSSSPAGGAFLAMVLLRWYFWGMSFFGGGKHSPPAMAERAYKAHRTHMNRLVDVQQYDLLLTYLESSFFNSLPELDAIPSLQIFQTLLTLSTFFLFSNYAVLKRNLPSYYSDESYFTNKPIHSRAINVLYNFYNFGVTKNPKKKQLKKQYEKNIRILEKLLINEENKDDEDGENNGNNGNNRNNGNNGNKCKTDTEINNDDHFYMGELNKIYIPKEHKREIKSQLLGLMSFIKPNKDTHFKKRRRNVNYTDFFDDYSATTTTTTINTNTNANKNKKNDNMDIYINYDADLNTNSAHDFDILNYKTNDDIDNEFLEHMNFLEEAKKFDMKLQSTPIKSSFNLDESPLKKNEKQKMNNTLINSVEDDVLNFAKISNKNQSRKKKNLHRHHQPNLQLMGRTHLHLILQDDTWKLFDWLFFTSNSPQTIHHINYTNYKQICLFILNLIDLDLNINYILPFKKTYNNKFNDKLFQSSLKESLIYHLLNQLESSFWFEASVLRVFINYNTKLNKKLQNLININPIYPNDLNYSNNVVIFYEKPISDQDNKINNKPKNYSTDSIIIRKKFLYILYKFSLYLNNTNYSQKKLLNEIANHFYNLTLSELSEFLRLPQDLFDDERSKTDNDFHLDSINHELHFLIDAAELTLFKLTNKFTWNRRKFDSLVDLYFKLDDIQSIDFITQELFFMKIINNNSYDDTDFDPFYKQSIEKINYLIWWIFDLWFSMQFNYKLKKESDFDNFTKLLSDKKEILIRSAQDGESERINNAKDETGSDLTNPRYISEGIQDIFSFFF
ncbi:uncharacterized protein ASCRUDRAFT_114375 [Ascoidea rubescens DSM 1968]|uniref:Uncharacterized protein n=1 Tax=Ascoidea rubescens DSM 1968 TaxID=1344418 RepID=A0A1D2VCP0_9ASCO|nr:hypothetical protein ASCRUDRAFT_114375 [Ascoidea rubescens DSM 1968]ODV59263.1 hypothetical protein ASCRUDRAFT_114375 [Ascoidea rubescens DSM 1968]